jgi:capsular exopolysaccharide synthesis family protein
MRFLQGTALPTLRVLTTGPLPPNPAELIGSQRMHELLERLQGQADILYIDSPPASVLADTAVLSAQSDGVLLVLQVGKTSRDVAKRTLAALEQVHAYVVGVVLNRMPTRRSGYYYHYYNYEYSKKYYRRGDKLTGEAVPVTPAVGGRNGNGLKQGVEAKTGDPV